MSSNILRAKRELVFCTKDFVQACSYIISFSFAGISSRSNILRDNQFCKYFHLGKLTVFVFFLILMLYHFPFCRQHRDSLSFGCFESVMKLKKIYSIDAVFLDCVDRTVWCFHSTKNNNMQCDNFRLFQKNKDDILTDRKRTKWSYQSSIFFLR